MRINFTNKSLLTLLSCKGASFKVAYIKKVSGKCLLFELVKFCIATEKHLNFCLFTKDFMQTNTNRRFWFINII